MRDAENSFREMFEQMGAPSPGRSGVGPEIAVTNEAVPDDYSPFPGLSEMPYG